MLTRAFGRVDMTQPHRLTTFPDFVLVFFFVFLDFFGSSDATLLSESLLSMTASNSASSSDDEAALDRWMGGNAEGVKQW